MRVFLIFKKIFIPVIIAIFLHHNIVSVYGVQTHSLTESDTLSPFSAFQHEVQMLPSQAFEGTPLSNKHFMLVVMSIAKFLLIESGDIGSLGKWVMHKFGDDYKEWTKIFDFGNIKVNKNVIKIPCIFGNKKYQTQVCLSNGRGDIAGNFNVKITEIKRMFNNGESLEKTESAVVFKKKIVKIGFSVLSSTEEKLVDDVRAAIEAGVEYVHVDYLDGDFTPGLPPFDCTEQIRKIRDMGVPLEVHFMAKQPSMDIVEGMMAAGLKKGRDTVSVHYEAFDDKSQLVRFIMDLNDRGLRARLVVNPETQIDDVEPYIYELSEYLDAIIVMMIIPGAGSRPFIETSLEKIRDVSRLLDSLGVSDRIDIISDGGLNENSVRDIIKAGVDQVVIRTWLERNGRELGESVALLKSISQQNNELVLLKDMLGNWGLLNFQSVADAIAVFCKGSEVFTKGELINTAKRLEGVKDVRINDDRVVDVWFSDKLVRFHKAGVISIEHLGLEDRTYYNGVAVKIYSGNVVNKTKGEYVLGISGSWHDSTAVLIKDGKMVAALEEERMSRVKHDSSQFPVNAIVRLMKEEQITWGDIKHIVFGWNYNIYVDTAHSNSPNDEFFRRMDEIYAEKKGILVNEVIRRNSCEKNKARFNVGKVHGFLQQMKEQYGTEYEPRVSFVGHSRSHAASAYYLCGFDDKVLTIALDGYGDTESGGVWIGENGKMREIAKFQLPNSIGWMYAAITEYMGFKPASDEGQVMGFAPYGEPWDSGEMDRVNRLREIFKEYIKFDSEKETLIADPENYYYGKMVEGKIRITESFQQKLEELGIYPAERSAKFIDSDNPKDRPYANLAFVLQERTSQVISDIVRFYCREKTETKGVDKVALAGGIALNILANGKLISDGLVYGENLFVQPAAGDSGIAIGASLVVSGEIYGDEVISEMEHVFYGPSYSDDEIRNILDEFGLKEGRDYRCLSEDELVEEAAEHISEAKAIAWFQSRSEVGPRALGARSILLNLTDDRANNTANIIKGRQPWRPSALSIIEEEAKEYFMNIGKSPFMVIAFPILHGKKVHVLSGVHQFGDKLARPQTVSREANFLYWKLLNRLGEKTDIPAVVNTSFNKQEPLVEHPEEAINTFFYMNKVHHLFIGSFILDKTENLKPRVISLRDESELKYLLDAACSRGDINAWQEVFKNIRDRYPNSHKVKISMDCGVYGEKDFSVPLVKDLFDGALQEHVLNFMAAMINNYATEFNAQTIYISSTYKKMENVIYQRIKSRLERDYKRMRYFANMGDEVEILPVSERKRGRAGFRRDMAVSVERLLPRELKGTYVGIDIDVSSIKSILIKDGDLLEKNMVEFVSTGGLELGSKIREIVCELFEKCDDIDGIGISFPGVVNAKKNEVIWLANYESKWREKIDREKDVEKEYKKLNTELADIEEQFGYGKISVTNNGTAFGIDTMNRDYSGEDIVIVVLGTTISTSRIERGLIDISRSEQSGAFAVNIGENVWVDEVCGVKGCFATMLRDTKTGEVVSASELAEKMVSWFKLMYDMNGDKKFVFTGKVMEGRYGENLIEEIRKRLDAGKQEYEFEVSLLTEHTVFGGAIGAAQLAMKRSLHSVMDALHRINMTVIRPQEEGTRVYYIITLELIPVMLRNNTQRFIKKLYRKHPFLKEKECIRLVPKKDLKEVIGNILAEKDKKSKINVALTDVEDISRLSGGVKALVFTGNRESDDFVQLEGIIAALRALQYEEISCLLKIYELLTGKKVNLTEFSEKEILSRISDPESLVKILLFELKPITGFTEILLLNNQLQRYIEEAA